MHRKPEAELPLDTKLERPSRNLRKVKMLNKKIWKIREKECKLSKKNHKQRDLRGK